MELSFRDILRAWPLVHRHLPRTPLYRYPLLSARMGLDAYVKHENHLPVGAFKVRGAVNLFANLAESQRAMVKSGSNALKEPPGWNGSQ